MSGKSDLPEPNKRVSVLLNHTLRRDNEALRTKLEGMEDTDKKRRKEIQTLEERLKTAMNRTDRAEGLLLDFKAVYEKHGVEIQMLREGIEAVQRGNEELVERVERLQWKQESLATDRTRKKSRTLTSTTQRSTNAVSLEQAAEGAPQPNPQPQTFTMPAPEDSSGTIKGATLTVPVSVPAIPRFHDGRIHQGTLTLREYTAACAQHRVAASRAADQSGNEPGPAERALVGQFTLGMREGKERKRLAEELEKKGLATIDRGTKAVEFLCGWGEVEKVLEGWWREMAGNKKDGRK